MIQQIRFKDVQSWLFGVLLNSSAHHFANEQDIYACNGSGIKVTIQTIMISMATSSIAQLGSLPYGKWTLQSILRLLLM